MIFAIAKIPTVPLSRARIGKGFFDVDLVQSTLTERINHKGTQIKSLEFLFISFSLKPLSFSQRF